MLDKVILNQTSSRMIDLSGYRASCRLSSWLLARGRSQGSTPCGMFTISVWVVAMICQVVAYT